jgi:hypothetical protein
MPLFPYINHLISVLRGFITNGRHTLRSCVSQLFANGANTRCEQAEILHLGIAIEKESSMKSPPNITKEPRSTEDAGDMLRSCISQLCAEHGANTFCEQAESLQVAIAVDHAIKLNSMGQ